MFDKRQFCNSRGGKKTTLILVQTHWIKINSSRWIKIFFIQWCRHSPTWHLSTATVHPASVDIAPVHIQGLWQGKMSFFFLISSYPLTVSKMCKRQLCPGYPQLLQKPTVCLLKAADQLGGAASCVRLAAQCSPVSQTGLNTGWEEGRRLALTRAASLANALTLLCNAST